MAPKSLGPRQMASLITNSLPKAVQKAHQLNTTRLLPILKEFEQGMADIVKEEDCLSIPYFGDFYLRHYKTRPHYVHRERAMLKFNKVPWHSFINTNFKEEDWDDDE